MEWWTWIVLGIILLGAEMIVPGGFFMLFFGFGAIIVGVLVLLNLAGPDWLQWFLFSVASLAMLLLLRQRVISLLGTSNTPEVDSLVGQTAIPLEAIAPGATGKVELRGSNWNGHNGTKLTLQKGQRCTVDRVEGLTLHFNETKHS